jgi:hypothetical protein
MAFPVRELSSAGGSLFGHVFENRLTEVRRDLYWSLSLDFSAMEYEGESWQTSVAAEWLVWPVRRWYDLDGMDLEKLSKPELAEASFYLAQHHAGRLERLDLSRTGETAFKVNLSLVCDLVEPNGAIASGTRIDAAGMITFDGVYVIPDNLAPKPRTEDEAVAATSEFIDTGDFERPVWERFKYVLAPKGAAQPAVAADGAAPRR